MYRLISNMDGALTRVVNAGLDDVIQGVATWGRLSPELAVNLLGQHLQQMKGSGRWWFTITLLPCVTVKRHSQNSFPLKATEGFEPWPCGCCAGRDRGTRRLQRTSSCSRCGSSSSWLQLLFCLKWETRGGGVIYLFISTPDSLDKTAL